MPSLVGSEMYIRDRNNSHTVRYEVSENRNFNRIMNVGINEES